MAIFPNSSDNQILDEQCLVCIFRHNPEDKCVIRAIHDLYNEWQTQEIINILLFLVDNDGVCRIKKQLEDKGVSIYHKLIALI